MIIELPQDQNLPKTDGSAKKERIAMIIDLANIFKNIETEIDFSVDENAKNVTIIRIADHETDAVEIVRKRKRTLKKIFEGMSVTIFIEKKVGEKTEKTVMKI